jgi:hypothetical protein
LYLLLRFDFEFDLIDNNSRTTIAKPINKFFVVNVLDLIFSREYEVSIFLI